MWYLLYNSYMGLYECEITDKFISIDFGDYQLVYLIDSDRLIIRLRGLGRFLGVFDHPSYLDIESKMSTIVLDAISRLLKESVIIYSYSR